MQVHLSTELYENNLSFVCTFIKECQFHSLEKVGPLVPALKFFDVLRCQVRTILLTTIPLFWFPTCWSLKSPERLPLLQKSTCFLIFPLESFTEEVPDSSMLSIHCHQPLYCQNYHSIDQSAPSGLVSGIVPCIFCCGLVFKGPWQYCQKFRRSPVWIKRKSSRISKIYIIKSQLNRYYEV